MNQSYYQRNREHLKEYSKLKKIEAINLKKFYCEDCDKAFSDKTRINNHLKIKKHNPERYVKYSCQDCNYSTSHKPRYSLHLESKKHINSNRKTEDERPVNDSS